MIKIWLKAFRLPFITATVVPIVLGNTIAWHDIGTLNFLHFWLTLIGISFLHLGTNLSNDYFDHKTNNDELNSTPTPVSGGSRVIQEKLLPAVKILCASLIFFGLGSMIGIYLAWELKSGMILALGIIGVFCGFFYTSFPIKIGYRGLGEAIVGLCFGPLVVFGSYYVQVNKFSLNPIWASVPVGILIFLVLFINEFHDCKADEMVGKKTLVVLMGKRRSVRLFHNLLWIIYFYMFLCVVSGALPLSTLIVFFILPFVFKIYFVSKANYSRATELLPANFATIGLHLSFGLLLSVGFILDKVS